MRIHSFPVAFALGLFASTNVFAQEAAAQPLPDVAFKALLGAPLPAPPSAEFPPSALRPFSVGQLNTTPSGTFQAVHVIAPKKATRWYGWKTTIGVGTSDVITLVGVVGSLASPFIGGPLLLIGFGGHLLTGPIVHWNHGHVGKGFASLGLNVVMPVLGGLIGAGVDSVSKDPYSTGAHAFMFATIGYFAGPLIDIAALSTEEVTPGAPKGAQLLLPSSVAIVPMLDANRRGLSIMGRF